MSEIKVRAERAQSYHRCLDMININTQWKWCISTGLWETAGWVGGNIIGWIEAHERDCRLRRDE